MLDIRYEMAARHQKEHIHLFDEIGAQIDDLNDGITSAVAIAQFIRRWLMDHVETSDRQLCPGPGTPLPFGVVLTGRSCPMAACGHAGMSSSRHGKSPSRRFLLQIGVLLIVLGAGCHFP